MDIKEGLDYEICDFAVFKCTHTEIVSIADIYFSEKMKSVKICGNLWLMLDEFARWTV